MVSILIFKNRKDPQEAFNIYYDYITGEDLNQWLIEGMIEGEFSDKERNEFSDQTLQYFSDFQLAAQQKHIFNSQDEEKIQQYTIHLQSILSYISITNLSDKIESTFLSSGSKAAQEYIQTIQLAEGSPSSELVKSILRTKLEVLDIYNSEGCIVDDAFNQECVNRLYEDNEAIVQKSSVISNLQTSLYTMTKFSYLADFQSETKYFHALLEDNK